MVASKLLADRLRQTAIVEGSFLLSGGDMSSVYWDCRASLLDATIARLAGEAVIDDLYSWTPAANASHVGSIGVGGSLLCAAVIAAAERDGFPMVKGCLVRDKKKPHGRHVLVDGVVQEGARTLLVDDVVTTGRTAARAIDALHDAGCNVVGFVGLINRGGEGLAWIRRHYGLSATCLFEDVDLL